MASVPGDRHQLSREPAFIGPPRGSRLFGLCVPFFEGRDAALFHLTGYAVEKSMAIDKMVVIAPILANFGIQRERENRVVMFVILGAIVQRAVMIGLLAAGIELSLRHTRWAACPLQ